MGNGVYLGAGSGITKGLWHLQGNSNDSSGNSKNGTDVNVSYGLAYGKFGQGAALSAQGGIAVPADTLGTIGTGSFFMSGWHYFAQPGAGKSPMILGSFGITAPYSGPTVYFDPLNVIGGGDAIAAYITYTNKQYCTTPAASSLYGGWHWIVFQRAGTTVCEVYIDAALRKQFNDNTNIMAAGAACIFSRDVTDQTQPTTARGDAFIWENVAWSQTKIQKHYTWAKGRFAVG